MGAGTQPILGGYSQGASPFTTEGLKKIAASRTINTPLASKAPQVPTAAPTSTILTDSLNMESRTPQRRTLLTA